MAALLLIPALASGDAQVGLSADGGLGRDNLTRDPNPSITVESSQDTFRYTLTTTAPDKSAAHFPRVCTESSGDSVPIIYRGDGTYSGRLTVYHDEDAPCDDIDQSRSFSFKISAATPVRTPATSLLRRAAGSATPKVWDFPVAYAPGAVAHEVVFGRQLSLSPGGFANAEGAATQVIPQAKAQVAFPAPGLYEVAARSKGANSLVAGGALGSPWSTVKVRVKEPFELKRVRFLDGSGPSYRVAAYTQQRTSGTVRVSISRGTRSRRFRRLGTVRMRKGRITKRFRLRQTGTYRLRYAFNGSNSVARGAAVAPIRIARRR